MTAKQQMVDRNYEAFKRELPKITAAHAGKFALMRNQKTVDFYDTDRDAIVAGNALYDDGEFTIQAVTQTPINLGYFSYAWFGRQV